MSNEPPTTEVPPPSDPTPPRRSWRSRLRTRGVVVTAAVAALVVIAGVTAALLLPDENRGRFGPGVDRAGWSGPPWAGDHRGDHRGDDRDGGWGDGWGDRDADDADEEDADRRGGPFGVGDDPILTGTVASVADGSITVNVDGSGPRTLRTDGDTEVTGPANSALGDLQTGERVVVEVEGTGDAATAESVWTPQARVTGTVTALSGDTATVTALDGLTATVDIAALSQRPAVGDVVVLTGTAADGTTIRADGIRILPRAS